MKHISFVVPVFNEEANLREFYQRLTDYVGTAIRIRSYFC